MGSETFPSDEERFNPSTRKKLFHMGSVEDSSNSLTKHVADRIAAVNRDIPQSCMAAAIDVITIVMLRLVTYREVLQSFRETLEELQSLELTESYPDHDGDSTVLGPRTILSPDESVINWKGENYYRDINYGPTGSSAAFS